MSRNKVKVTSIENKMREARLKWFGQVRRRSADAPVGRCEKIVLPEGRRGLDRPKKSWNKVIRHDLNTLGLMEDMIQDRKL